MDIEVETLITTASSLMLQDDFFGEYQPVRHLDNITLEEFVKQHLEPNIPVLVGPSISKKWSCLINWTKGSKPPLILNPSCVCGNEVFSTQPELCQSQCPSRINMCTLKDLARIPNFSYIRENFGGSAVNVTDCETRDFNSTQTKTMTVSKFIDEWESVAKTNSFPCDAEFPQKKIYLKDWHFHIDYPDYLPYEVPEIFQEDWMDSFWIHRTDLAEEQTRSPPWSDDHRFVYMGSPGTWTPFHTDVLK
ncbi:hypothetical protein DSO57_1010486 [Entomophthora muscae]|uniref:Uncharacterized protein n=1 Tax=Entomophthora muscae TaxID=34485 RepID=A0ACC2SJA8_9FUNG|nr:hypothetical protein DSO57_1010486 [Entomophthora muscae]